MRKFRRRTLGWLALLLFLALFAAIVLRWISLERLRLTLQRLGPPILPTPTATPDVFPTPTPWRTPIIGGKLDTAKLWSGITVHAEVDPTPGGAASVERLDPQSYVLDLHLKVRVPTANATIEELAEVTPELPKLLPNLAATIGPDPVSPLFQQLYDLKVQTLRQDLVRLDQLLSRHNFYDCQTILRLRHPETKREAILLQAEMDVDADGSDADRIPLVDGSSANFKPFTSYRWKKKTAQPSPFLPAAEAKLHRYETEFARKGLTMERNRDLRIGIQRMKAEVDSLKRFSFLIASTDPYIVLPGIFGRGKNVGKVGDYAVIVYGDQIYPAIVGDVGPSDKVGEASLRIAKEINAQSTPYSRPVSDLRVTYLIFPETADTSFGPPDFEKIRVRCEKLVQEMGGASVPLYHWKDIVPTPMPSPTPTPTPSPSPTPSPNESPTPTPLVGPTFAFPTPVSPAPENTLSPTPSPSLIPTTSPLVTSKPSP
ncbi:MAG TPA: glycoside hydrolase family 75 protein [Chthoniobacterales bacterium]|nr:glycoside hydrolase family 75 protein [Chthoniobacterales bacterium]